MTRLVAYWMLEEDAPTAQMFNTCPAASAAEHMLLNPTVLRQPVAEAQG